MAGGPLEGVRIIDLTSVVIGPLATQILADHGADVIKVESPAGDLGRVIGGFGVTPGMGPKFLHLNRQQAVYRSRSETIRGIPSPHAPRPAR